MASQWQRILIVWLCGVLAAAQLTKLSALAPSVSATFEINVAEVGLLISLIEIGGASLGLLGGLIVARLGAVFALRTGLVLLLIGALLEALVTTVYGLFGARILEGFGYLFIVISAPALIATIADDGKRGQALALWSTFIPIGLGLGNLGTGAIIEIGSLSSILVAWAACVALALVASFLVKNQTTEVFQIATPNSPMLLYTICFGVFTFFSCSVILLAPTFLVERLNFPLWQATVSAGVSSLAALLGTLGLWSYLRKKTIEAPQAKLIVISASTLMMASVWMFFRMSETSSMLPATITLSIFMAAGGILSPIIFARIPELIDARKSTGSQLAVANGLLTQFGALGALAAPPVIGLIVSSWGWGAIPYFLLPAAVTISLLVSGGERRALSLSHYPAT
ncbi:MFS transporter [Erythrobacter donghaensis]|uniref:MFS transporter n=1 Tax=Erythrobacter donghaensis TaxID=267135 RepID=UPI0009BED4CE|nr:MFS transporter [Erythrobacter donghaensis]